MDSNVKQNHRDQRRTRRMAVQLTAHAILFSLVFLRPLVASEDAKVTPIDLRAVTSDHKLLVMDETNPLATGELQAFKVVLDQVVSLEFRVHFAEAPFNGTQLNARINGKRLLPYFAFGGDTRYENVKDVPGMRPPLADIEGRWIIPASLLVKGNNELIIWTTGVQESQVLDEIGPKPNIRIDSVLLGPADGSRLPVYSNTVYYDFDVWAQGYAWGNQPNRYRYDLALLGVINGKGMVRAMPTLGGSELSLWDVKRKCEENFLGWRFPHHEFYTIWEFAGKPQHWAKFVDVDKNPQTQSESLGVHPHVAKSLAAAHGADIALYSPKRYAASLEPAIRVLAPYTDFYNFRCEQLDARGLGYGDMGRDWEKYGVTGYDWAKNFYAANKAARDLVMKYDPVDGRVQEMNFWTSMLRHYLYDSALKRNQPMKDIVDILMTHHSRIVLPSYDYAKNGKLDPNNWTPEWKQYPGGKFDKPKRFRYRDYWHTLFNLGIPEDAIDFNRYRLGRSEKDMIHGDPKVNRWADGRPFDFRAGFRGDEMMYNSENGAYVGQSAPAPYQFLHAFSSYSLLPTGATEPRDLMITTRQSVTETEDLTINLYGEWIDGAGHTKRLRTVDPLYGDLFGWTGQEFCNSGDYIKLVGIKDAHHRLPQHDAYGFVRRTCYAFVTSGPVVPAYLNEEHDDNLFVKCLVQTLNHKQYIGLYTANFDEKPHMMDVTLPITFPSATKALVFDNLAWDWSSQITLRIESGKAFAYKREIPALSAWMVLIPTPPGVLENALGLPKPPILVSPIPDAACKGKPTLCWKAREERGGIAYVVEVSREALFREEDRVELSDLVDKLAYTMRVTPKAQWRYFWRAKAIDGNGRVGAWSEPRAFVYKWPEYSKRHPPKTASAKKLKPQKKGKKTKWEMIAVKEKLERSSNLAWQGEVFASGGHMNAPSHAVDGQAFSFYVNDDDEEGTEHILPAEWAVIWPEPITIRGAKILWLESAMPKNVAIQVSNDGDKWRTVRKIASPKQLTSCRLPTPAEVRYFRIYAKGSVKANGKVGLREVLIK